MARTGRSSDQPGHISNIIKDLESGDEAKIVINRPPNNLKDAIAGKQTYTKRVVVESRRRGTFNTYGPWQVHEVSVRMKDTRHRFSLMTLVPTRDDRAVFNVKRGERNLYTVQSIEVVG